MPFENPFISKSFNLQELVGVKLQIQTSTYGIESLWPDFKSEIRERDNQKIVVKEGKRNNVQRETIWVTVHLENDSVLYPPNRGVTCLYLGLNIFVALNIHGVSNSVNILW